MNHQTVPEQFVSGKLPVGSRVKFFNEKQMYTVRASNVCFAVCTKPFNARKTVLYTVIDLKEGIRGTEDLIFSRGAETFEQCQEMLERLTQWESEISHRNRVPLNEKYGVEFIRYPKDKKK